MVRRNSVDDLRAAAESAAWREYGKRNYAWIIGWRLLKVPLAIAVVLVPVALGVMWVARTIGSVSAPGLSSTPESAGPFPWILLALSAAGAAALTAYRWANPYRGGAALIAGIVACLALSVLAVLWAQAAF